MTRKKRTKKLTIAELKSYVRGAVDLNPEGWCPNQDQWEQIADLIENVKDSVVVDEPYTTQGNDTELRPRPIEEVRSAMMPIDDMGASGRFDASANPGHRPQVERIAGGGVKDEQTGVVQSGIMIKTPNVDTSEEKYKSGYE